MTNTKSTRPTAAELRPNKSHADAQRLLDAHYARLDALDADVSQCDRAAVLLPLDPDDAWL
jgi:hypothetical protein